MDNTWFFFALGAAAGATAAWKITSGRMRRRQWQEVVAKDVVPATNPLDQPVNLRCLLDALEQAVIVVGRDKEILLANQACQRFFPGVQDILGRRLPTVWLDPKLNDMVAACLADGATGSLEIRGGETGDAVWRASVAPMPGDGVDGLARIILQDETEHVRTEQIRREFVANASHELRTPLTIVHGYIESLLDGACKDPELSLKFLKTARRHTERMGRLIEDMLAVAKLESGERELLRIKEFSLSKCLARVSGSLATLIEQNSATLESAIDPVVERMNGDRFYWEQIFFNLIENALKNNPEAGLRVMVSARPLNSGGLEIKVSDNGIGIPKASLPFIFKRFYRVQQNHSSEVPGTGLGLSIVKRAVEAHGGVIGVESLPGQHTTFTITLPRPSRA